MHDPKGLGVEDLQFLRKLLSEHDEVVLAYLFGSAAKEGFSGHDVDLAVVLRCEDKLGSIASLIGEVSRALNVPEDKVDILDIDRAGLHLKYAVLTKGVKLVDKEGLEHVLTKELVDKYPAFNLENEYFHRLWLKEDPEIDRKLLFRRLDELLRSVTMIREKYIGKDLSWFSADLERAYAFERAMHRAIEAMLGICRHIVSAKRLGLVEYYSDYPLRIAEANLMDTSIASKISVLAKLRNILIHEYTELDYERLIKEAQSLTNEIAPKFTEWLRKLMANEK